MNGTFAWLHYLVRPLRWHLPPVAHASRQDVERARAAIRAGDAATAAAELAGCGDTADADPECLNLLGLIAESLGDWPEARRQWSRAVALDPHCLAARQNLRRYYELCTWGRCRHFVAYGDEPELRRPREATS